MPGIGFRIEETITRSKGLMPLPITASVDEL